MKLTARSIYKDLKKWLNEWPELQKIKDKLDKDTLARIYWEHGKDYIEMRDDYHYLIASDPILYADVKDLASKNFMFDILIDGWSYDKNKTERGESPVLPFLPFPHQVDLIHTLQHSKKHVHIEKSRRQGVSVIVYMYFMWQMKHKKHLDLAITHKDANSLDLGGNGDNDKKDEAKNSVLVKFRWWADMSIFIPDDWRDRKKYWVTKSDAKGIKEYKEFFTENNFIVLNGNKLSGGILGKSTNVGFASDEIAADEVDVVCDNYPNLAPKIVQGFVSSVNRVILLSTYRSKDYPFYGYKRTNNTKRFDFLRLHWSDNPTCNQDWYEDQRARYDDDEVMVARELDINPNKTREGTVYGHRISKSNYYTDLYRRDKNLLKVVGADFGGGSSATVFIFGYYNMLTGKLYLDDILKTTTMEAEEIAQEFRDKGFFYVPINGDRSGAAQGTTPSKSWFKLLEAEGLRLNPISNLQPYAGQAKVRIGFMQNMILINKNCEVLNDDLTLAAYKNDELIKDSHSHTADALLYLHRALTTDSMVHQEESELPEKYIKS